MKERYARWQYIIIDLVNIQFLVNHATPKVPCQNASNIGSSSVRGKCDQNVLRSGQIGGGFEPMP